MHTTKLTHLLIRTVLLAAPAVAASAPSLSSAQSAPHCLNSVHADGHIALHFEVPQAVDHIVISLDKAPAGTVMRISDGVYGANIALLAGAPNVAEAQLRTALRSTDFVVSVARQSPSDDAVCVTDVMLTDGAQRLSPSLADSVAQGTVAHADADADADAKALVGTWLATAACGARATLQFHADGTFVLTHAAVASLSGNWRMVGGQLQMRLAGSPSFMPVQRITQDVDGTNAQDDEAKVLAHTVLMLRSAHLPALAGTFTSDAHRS